MLEDPAQEVPDYVYSRTIDPEKAPDQPTFITIDFEKGDATAIDGKKLSPAIIAGESSTSSVAPTASAGSTSSKTVSSA